MMMASWQDPDELIVCPYDPVHRLQRKRLQYHLIKCRKNFNPRDFKQCPFNARHVIPAPEFRYHIEVCEDRGKFEAEQLQGDTGRDPSLRGNTSIPDFDPSWTPATTESWDDDNVVYVPPNRDGLLFSREETHDAGLEQSPELQEHQPRPPREVLGGDVEQLRPPKNSLQNNTQIFQHAMQSGRGFEGRGTNVCRPVGRGRGRGRGRGQGNLSMLEGELVVGRSRAGVARVPVNSVSLLDEHKHDLMKKRRKLQKMLRQIERIESKTTPLQEEEVMKMRKKDQVLDQLRQLEEAGIID